MKDNKALGWQLSALAVAAAIATSEGRESDADRYLQEARRLAELPMVDNAVNHENRLVCLRALRETEGLEHAMHNVGRAGGTSLLFLGAECLQGWDDLQAVAKFSDAIASEHSNSACARLSMAHLVRGTENGHQRTKELIKDMLDSSDPFECVNALYAYCLVATPEEIHPYARRLLDKMHAREYVEGTFEQRICTRILAGEDIEQCVRDADEGALPESQIHYTIGMLRLAQKDRDGAFEHFRRSAETIAIGTFAYEWARAYYERMEGDPNWPYWLGE